MNTSARTNTFVKPIRKLLTEEEEHEKFIAWRQARDSGEGRKAKLLLEELVLHYTPIIRKMVKRMSGYGIEQDELISVGLLALVRAADRFDLDKGFRFSTYATPWIRGVLFEFITENYFMTNICSSSTNKKLFFSMRNYIASEAKRTGAVELTPEMIRDMAKKFEVKETDIVTMNNILRSPYESLNEVIAGEDDVGLTKEDLLESPDQNAEDILINTTNRDYQTALVQKALDRLDERERSIFESQVLQDKDNTLTLEDLGLKFNISKERVRQIRNNAMDKVKKSVLAQIATTGTQPSEFLN